MMTTTTTMMIAIYWKQVMLKENLILGAWDDVDI